MRMTQGSGAGQSGPGLAVWPYAGRGSAGLRPVAVLRVATESRAHSTIRQPSGAGPAFLAHATAEDTSDIAGVRDLPPPPAERAKGSVLLVDDEPIILEFAEAALASHGYDVVAVSNGQDALRAMAERRFDLAVLDVSMPAPDGWEVLAQIRESSPQTRVVMASGYAVEQKVRERSAFGFLEKPYRLPASTLGSPQAVTRYRRTVASSRCEAASAASS